LDKDVLDKKDIACKLIEKAWEVPKDLINSMEEDEEEETEEGMSEGDEGERKEPGEDYGET